MSGPRAVALVLAAGASRRMGWPKLTLPWGDTTVLGQVLRTVAATGTTEILVVTGCDADLVTPIAVAQGAATCYHPGWSAGMTSSLQAGLRTVATEVEAVLVVLGDQPMILPTTVETVLAAIPGPAAAVVPTYGGRRGHPVRFGRLWFDALLSLAPSEPPRAVLVGGRGPVVELEVADPAILADLDLPADVARWSGAATGSGGVTGPGAG